MNFRPYVSLDLETTGLDVQASLPLQIAMVFDDGINPVNRLPIFNILIDNSNEQYNGKLEHVALRMNMWIFDELIKKEKSEYKILKPEDARLEVRNFLAKIFAEQKGEKLILAGKNVQGFDIQILKNQNYLPNELLKHRVIDIGSLYLPDFGFVPNTEQLGEKLNMKITHNALEDAFFVVKAIRMKLGVPL